ncbi:IS1096 element passenger TnpR family protein [Sphaerisporangium sp. NBC_01403]|uniref:IS1096 element passenger TnpR family protein n=1 Tax=Sphaerisporangium sp. NBC_01403 TaxID=2903599 RepID=UPI0038634F68
MEPGGAEIAAAKNTTYPRCPAGGRACPPEDSGGPEGFAAHLRALGHRKGWKYAQAREVFGSGRWVGRRRVGQGGGERPGGRDGCVRRR